MWEITLPPLQSVSAITYVDADGATQTITASDYLVDSTSTPARITPAYGKTWPTPREQNNAVKVRFIAGYGLASAVPECIKTWMLMRIKQIYDQQGFVNVGSVAEFPHSYVDGILDAEKVWRI